jgi:hypothetical protein
MVPARQATWAGGIYSLESIPGFHKRLKVRAQVLFLMSLTMDSVAIRRCLKGRDFDTNQARLSLIR